MQAAATARWGGIGSGPSLRSRQVWAGNAFAAPRRRLVFRVAASQGPRLPPQGPPSQPQAFHKVEDLISTRLGPHGPSPGSRWREVGECWVLYPRGDEPNAVVHFTGGAFVGAAPQLAYRTFLEALANRGILVIATPFHTGFDHTRVADDIHFKFQRALKELGSHAQALPVYGMGHSLGSLLQLLIGSRYLVKLEGNILLSYTNKPVTDAMPLFSTYIGPGSQLVSPLLAQLAASPLRSSIESLLMAFKSNSPELVRQLAPLIEQLVPIYADIARGRREFIPSTAECTDIIKEGYGVERNLLVQFTSDGLDDSDRLTALLTSSSIADVVEVQRVSRPGTHLRPLQQDLGRLGPEVGRWASGARSSSEAFLDGVDSLAGQAGVPPETRRGLVDLARAAGDLAGAMSDAILGGGGGTGVGPASAAAEMEALADECAVFMGLLPPPPVPALPLDGTD